MNFQNKLLILVFGLILSSVSLLYGQVTIGSSFTPRTGTILDLKQNDNLDANSKLGLLLPRVNLISNSLLEPVVTNSESNDIDIKKSHVGLLVYNVGQEIINTKETQLCKGAHTWIENKWIPLIPYPVWTPGVNVLYCQDGGKYSIDCSSVKVYGSYKKNVPLDNNHYVEVQINADASAIGRKYILESYSEENNGIKFRAEGTINNQVQTVRLQGSGSLNSYGVKNFTLVSNSSSIEEKCSFKVEVIYPVMKIVGVGAYNYHPASEIPSSKSYVLMSNPRAFGKGDEAKIKVDGFSFKNYLNRTDAEWIALLKSKPDIIIRAYPATMSDGVSVELKKYLDAGGIFIDFNDNNGTSNAGVQALYGPSAVSNKTASAVTGQIMPFTDVDDEILNGPWLDLRNKSWSEDASITQGIAGVPESQIIIYSRSSTNGNPVVIFRDKSVNYVYIGDGGFLSGAAATSVCCYPFQLGKDSSDPTTYNLPISSTNNKGVMYNSHFFANLMSWALNQAATNGINKY